MSQELQYLEYELVSKAFTRDIEQAHNHTKNHITVHREIVKLDAECEYCKIYFEGDNILKTNTPYPDQVQVFVAFLFLYCTKECPFYTIDI
jgi:hypothetical protein